MGSSHSTPTRQQATLFPPDVTQRIASFLLGIELLQYATASPVIFAALNEPHVWSHRLDPALLNTADIAQRRPRQVTRCREFSLYVQQRAFAFRGLAMPTWRDRWRTNRADQCGDFVPLPDEMLEQVWPAWSFECTFSLVSIQAENTRGGILLGFQDTSCVQYIRQGWEPHLFFPVASVDANGHLQVGNEMPGSRVLGAVAHLVVGQWHHLKVDIRGLTLTASLDGEERLSTRLRFVFPTLPYGQFGTGYGHDPTQRLTTAWRPFHGLIAEARITRAWTIGTESLPCYSIWDQSESSNVVRVMASQPCERYARILLTPVFFAAFNEPHVWSHRLDPAILDTGDLAQRRARPRVTCCREFSLYLQQRAFAFRGIARPTWRDRWTTNRAAQCGDFVALPDGLLQAIWPVWTFECTFSLMPATAENRFIGGILLGFQDVSCDLFIEHGWTSYVFFAVVSVDADGRLEVGKEMPGSQVFDAVADLAFGRWYNLKVNVRGLVLTVYLDGEELLSTRSRQSLPALSYGQIGTGLGYDPARMLVTAWRPFHGLVADARLTGAWIVPSDATSGSEVPTSFSLQNQRDSPRRVLASQPREQYARILPT